MPTKENSVPDMGTTCTKFSACGQMSCVSVNFSQCPALMLRLSHSILARRSFCYISSHVPSSPLIFECLAFWHKEVSQARFVVFWLTHGISLFFQKPWFFLFVKLCLRPKSWCWGTSGRSSSHFTREG